MFTKCLKLTKKSAAALILVAGVIMAALVIVCSNPQRIFSTVDMINVSDTEGRVKYLAGCGWKADPDSEHSCDITLPREFSGVLSDYAEMQTRQGYDFASCGGAECSQFTYTVTNYEGFSGTVYATLYVKGTRVIGGDIHSASIDGFMHALR